MLGFVNYAHFSKKFRIDASDLYFFKVYKKSLNNYMQQKGKWQKHVYPKSSTRSAELIINPLAIIILQKICSDIRM